MFLFEQKKFTINCCANNPEDPAKYKTERDDIIAKIADRFSIVIRKCHGDVIVGKRGKYYHITWYCMMNPDNWKRFREEVNAFTDYDSKRIHFVIKEESDWI